MLEAPQIYSFVDLLSLPNVQNLKNTEYEQALNLLHIFSTGCLQDLRSLKHLLTEKQLRKIKHLTLVSLSLKQRVLPYQYLISQLEMENVRQLEDLIIDAIYEV